MPQKDTIPYHMYENGVPQRNLSRNGRPALPMRPLLNDQDRLSPSILLFSPCPLFTMQTEKMINCILIVSNDILNDSWNDSWNDILNEILNDILNDIQNDVQKNTLL